MRNDIVAVALTMISTSIAPMDITILHNMRMARQVEGRWITPAAGLPPHELPPHHHIMSDFDFGIHRHH